MAARRRPILSASPSDLTPQERGEGIDVLQDLLGEDYDGLATEIEDIMEMDR